MDVAHPYMVSLFRGRWAEFARIWNLGTCSQNTSHESLLIWCPEAGFLVLRDIVFALQGIANDKAAEAARPVDYLSSWPISYSTARHISKRHPKMIGHGTAEGAKTRQIQGQCSHDTISENDVPGTHCDGLECDAWWCCLDMVLHISRPPKKYSCSTSPQSAGLPG